MVDPLYNMSYHVDSDVPFGKLHLQKKHKQGVCVCVCKEMYSKELVYTIVGADNSEIHPCYWE